MSITLIVWTTGSHRELGQLLQHNSAFTWHLRHAGYQHPLKEAGICNK